MPPLHAICILAMALAVVGSANAQSSPEAAIPVGVDNFVRAESDLYLGKMVALGSTIPDYHQSFGLKGAVTPSII